MNIFQIVWNLFRKKENTAHPVSPEMQSSLEVWRNMYVYGGTDRGENHSLGLPAGISSEFARLILAESNIKINGSGAEYIQEQFDVFWRCFFREAESACALGSMAFKPYVSGNRIVVDLVRADQYAPTAFDSSGNVTSAVFIEKKTVGKRYYTRLEAHFWDANAAKYTVENRAYASYSPDILGTQCKLSEVAGWEELQEYQEIENVTAPLFSVFRIPSANRIDMDSPVGVSVFANAVDLIHEANRQWDKILWEYTGTELAVDASMDLFERETRADERRTTVRRWKLPKGGLRLFRRYDLQNGVDISKMLQVFSPAIRDSSLFNGLNHMLQRIEFNVGLAYGTISEPTMIEKTAEEIKTSKQRSYIYVSSMQNALESALEALVYAMRVYASLYDLAPFTDASITCSWGDSVLEDTDKEFQRRMQMVGAGVYRKEQFLMWYFGCDEKTASGYLPAQTNDGGLFSGSDV